MTPENLQGNVRLYACGGGGINVGHRFEKHRGQLDAGFATIDTAYIDTSMSNMRADIKAEHCYLLEGLDGSGKIRKENYQEIASRTRDILQRFQPADLNIVLSTAAGGSGSVIAPSLVSELLDLGLPTVVVCIGSAETKLDTENTLKTLKSYEAVARLREAPVVVAYFQNGDGSPRSKVDAKIESLVVSLCALFSRQNRELDSKDLFNFLRFDRVTSFGPMVAALNLVDKDSKLDGLGSVITVATIAADEETVKFPQMPQYQCAGFVPATISEQVLSHVPLHFVTSDGVITEAALKLQNLLKELEASQKSRTRAANLLTTSDSATDNGLVL